MTVDAKKKSAADAAPAGVVLERKEFQLNAPVHVGDEERTVIVVTEPLMHQIVAAARKAEKNKTHNLVELLSLISDMPAAGAGKLRARDLGRISRWIKGLNDDALKADGLLDQPDAGAVTDDPFSIDPSDPAVDAMSDEDIDNLEGSRTFKLICPVLYEGQTTANITATEPTIDAMMSATKYKLDIESRIAMVAGVTGQTIPVINRMTQRDFVRVEAWTAPFVRDLVTANTGGT